MIRVGRIVNVIGKTSNGINNVELVEVALQNEIYEQRAYAKRMGDTAFLTELVCALLGRDLIQHWIMATMNRKNKKRATEAAQSSHNHYQIVRETNHATLSANAGIISCKVISPPEACAILFARGMLAFLYPLAICPKYAGVVPARTASEDTACLSWFFIYSYGVTFYPCYLSKDNNSILLFIINSFLLIDANTATCYRTKQ